MSINFSTFEIGRSALMANQLGIDVTGQNIANVNTQGYSRLRVMQSEAAITNSIGNSIRGGVAVEGVQAFRDRFIGSRIQTETGISGRLTAQKDIATQVEGVLQGGESGGLQTAINNFFGTFRDLDANPDSAAARAVTVQRGAAVASSFQSTRSRLDDIRRSADGQMRSVADEVNSLSQSIAGLNGRIRDAESVNGDAAALRDQREELVNRFSELTGARTTENDDGTITLTIGEGRAIVRGSIAEVLQTSSVPPLGLTALSLDGQPAIFEEGAIRGLQNAITETTSQIDTLDGLAAEFARRVNALHTSGTDQDGNAGINFFGASVPVTAANITINPAISSNPRLIVASPLGQPGQSGTVAGAIANLMSDKSVTAGSHTGSLSSIYGSMLADAGASVNSAENGLQIQSAILAQANAQRESVSGVSLDEEAVNLLRYQRAYEAAARFLRVADEMTQTIISLAG